MSTNVNLTLQIRSGDTLKDIAISYIIHHFLDQHYMDHSLLIAIFCPMSQSLQLQIPTNRLDSSSPPAIISFSFKDYVLPFSFKLCEDGCSPSND